MMLHITLRYDNQIITYECEEPNTKETIIAWFKQEAENGLLYKDSHIVSASGIGHRNSKPRDQHD